MLSFAAALLLAQAQPPLPMPPSQPPEQEPRIIYETAPPAPPKRRDHDGQTERETGLIVLAAGYLMGSLIVIYPALPTNKGFEAVQNAGEKRLALIPVAGPMVWWSTASARLERKGGWDGMFDSGFHHVLGLPYAVVATGAQAVGVGLLTYGILTANKAVASSAAPPLAELHVAPTPGGLSLQGTF